MSRRNGRRALTAIGFAFAGTVGLLSGPAQAGAGSAQIADLTYDVYVGGLHIFTFDAEMTLQPDHYRLTADGETRGLVGWLHTWNLKLAAEGLDRNGRIEPQHYLAETRWRSRQRTLELGFAEGGRYDLDQTPPPEPDPDIEGDLPESLPNGILDPLSFAIAASRTLQEHGRCDQTVPVFDGQRRFDIVVKQIGETTLAPNAYSIYQGPAMRCSLGVARISGFRKSLQSSREQTSGPPTIWMASIRPDLPPLPVRYEGEIKLGKIVIHLADAKFRTESAVDSAD
jgi:hypothetical protein